MNKHFRLSPTHIILFSFLGVIFIGSVLLALPFSSASGEACSYLDALFTASYAVFGLGRYGLAVAKALAASGADVLAVDSDPNIVNSSILSVPICKCADITDPEAINQLGISNLGKLKNKTL